MLYPAELRAQSDRVHPSAGMKRDDSASDYGRGGGIRTPDPLLPKQMRYQTALRPASKPAPHGTANHTDGTWERQFGFGSR